MAFTHIAASLLMLAVLTVAADNYVEAEVRVETPHVPKRISKPELAIEGQIFCKSDHSTNYPIQGAKVKLVCPVVDSYGKLVGKFTISSYSTDVNGYFFFILYGLSHNLNNINGCKVKLDLSTLVSTCKIPTNLNNGITGASLSSNNYKLLSHRNLDVYTVGPFYFEATKSIHQRVDNNVY